MKARILMLGDAEPLFAPVAEVLLEQGHEVVRRPSTDGFDRDVHALADVDVLYALGSISVTDAHLANAPRLRALVSPITGTEGFDRAAATERCIVIGIGQPAENYVSMAEATIMLVLAALYDLKGSIAQFNEWAVAPAPQLFRRTLRGRTLGLIGLGQISRAMIQRLAPWECTILVHARHPADAPTGVTLVPLDRLLIDSDVVCVLASLDSSNRHLLDEERLRAMRRDAILINTARGGLVDEIALARLVQEGHLAALALDVFETEPLPEDDPLRSLPRSILTPHNAGHTVDTMVALPRTAIANIERVVVGEAPLYVRNPEVLPQWLMRWGGNPAKPDTD